MPPTRSNGALPHIALASVAAIGSRGEAPVPSCPRIVDRLNGVANQKLGSADTAGARLLLKELLHLDPQHNSAKFALAACDVKDGNEAAAKLSWERTVAFFKKYLA